MTSGSYTEIFARHTDISLATKGNRNLSDGTQYAPYTLRGIQYGKQFGLTNISVEDTFEPAIVYLDDANITESNQATVDAYTEIETPQKFYDRAVSWLESNITDEQAFLVSRSGQLINAGSYNVEVDSTAASVFDFNGSKITIKATEFIGDITTTGTITLSNGAKIIGTATDSGGTTTTLRYSIAGLVANSNVRIYNVTDNSEVFVGIVAGTSLDGTYTEGVEISSGDTINVNTVNTNGTTAYYEETSTVIATSTGVNALVSQSLNTIYNDNNIDGSTVTGITLDVPNVEFDLDEADNTISSQEIYAWYMNELMTTDGIRTIYKAIDPKSQYRYCIDPSVVDLKFDNKDLVNSLAITEGYFYRLNNTSVIASGSGNIEMIPNESYVANSAEIVSGINSIESKVDIVDNNVDQVLSDTDELQQNQGNWLTATGFSTFNPASDQVIVATNNDKTGYSISGTKNTLDDLNDVSASDVYVEFTTGSNEDVFKADVSNLDVAVSTRNAIAPDNAGITANGNAIAALNDIAATDIVSNGAITTLAGAVVNVDTVDTCTTNTDMRGTDGANTIAPDNAGITANGNAIAALNNFDPSTDQVIVATNNDKTNYSLTTADKDDIVDRNWDEPYSQHTTAGTFGKLMDLLRKANRAIEGEVTGTPTTTSFTSNITGYVTGAFDSEVLVFVSGTINGEARPILDYDSTNGTFNFEEAWTQAPSSSDEFVILPYHVHAISEIQEGLATRNNQNTINENVKKSSKLIPASGNLPDA